MSLTNPLNRMFGNADATFFISMAFCESFSRPITIKFTLPKISALSLGNIFSRIYFNDWYPKNPSILPTCNRFSVFPNSKSSFFSTIFSSCQLLGNNSILLIGHLLLYFSVSVSETVIISGLDFAIRF